MTVAPAPTLTLGRIQRQARVYPGYLLPRGGTALSLFCAGYHGWNDTIHFQRHNMRCDCVDTDADKLWEMAAVYPQGWAFWVMDGWDFAEKAAAQGQVWDVVSVDTWLGELADRSMQTLDLWTSLARELVTVTIPVGARPGVPDGWTWFEFPRSPRASWLVLQHA